mmetsp:Transcript_28057/g.47180  ORF Transcript_28057/g.47180 Transcript_28057/m.47180 type:complete len:873 (+) Transcript_28057:128-2746(+)
MEDTQLDSNFRPFREISEDSSDADFFDPLKQSDSAEEELHGDPAKYIQLKNYAGLTGPAPGRLSAAAEDGHSGHHRNRRSSRDPDQDSNRGSVVSSLSSQSEFTSQGGGTNREEDNENYRSRVNSLADDFEAENFVEGDVQYEESGGREERGRRRSKGEEDIGAMGGEGSLQGRGEEGELEQQEEENGTNMQEPRATINSFDKAKLMDVFEHLFGSCGGTINSSRQDSGKHQRNSANSSDAKTSTSSGGNSTSPPTARENIYYRDNVKVTSTLPAKENRFKEHTCLVQTLGFHRGAIWTMKVSPSGCYLCTGGQDTSVVVWRIAAPADGDIETASADKAGGEKGSSNKSANSSNNYNNNDKNNDDDNNNNDDDQWKDDDDDNIRFHGSSDGMEGRRSRPSKNMPTGNSSGNLSDMSKTIADASLQLRTFIHPEPYRILEGHTGDVIDVAWSKSHFILSASTDKTVCLWHVSRAERLQYFRHPDIVTAVEFHPAHDRYYISGCFDRKLRVWDIIPDGIVQEWTQTTDTITSICFSPDGKTVASGLIQGKVFFYDLIDFDQLRYKTQMSCRNHSGKYKHGMKVTGMCYRPQLSAAVTGHGGGGGPGATSTAEAEASGHHGVFSFPSAAAAAAASAAAAAASDMYHTIRRQGGGEGGARARTSRAQAAEAQLLVSTNDNRVRLCRLDDYSMVYKYKRLHNKCMQIKSSFSTDGKYIICGSENGIVHIWSTTPKKDSTLMASLSLLMGQHSNRNYGQESFECTTSPEVAATVALFAPVDSLFLHLQNHQHIVQSQSQSATRGTGTGSKSDGWEKSEGNTTSITGGGTKTGPLPSSRRQSSINNTANSATAQMEDFGTRIVITADYEGLIRVFFRIS